MDPESEDDTFEANEWPFYWLTHATGLYLTRMERGLKKEKLDIPRWRVLMCVKPDDARSVSEIAEMAIVKLPTMTKLVQRMETEGLVSCETRASDGRVTDVSLTPMGIDARKRAWLIARRVVTRVFADRDIDIEKLNKLLRQVVACLNDD